VTGADETVPVTDRFLRIPAAGGRVLSARLWRPEGAARWPVILDFSPYRVFDLFRGYHETAFPYWAARGYAVMAVDIAGSGASDGLLIDEYLPSEIDDACAVIDWCAAQDWCDGAVGLCGFSWAAFTALRVSDRTPAAVKAMVLGGVSEDGWRTDVHYLGGVPYAAQVDWAGVMMMFNALPPHPDQVGEDWHSAWEARLAANRPWLEQWLSHPTHDDWWKAKSSALTSKLPVLLYAGLADKYATSVLRIAEQWRGPVRTIIGPWEHVLPNLASRGPRIGFLQEALRWWDLWLKGRETGAMAEAPLRLFVSGFDRDGAPAAGTWSALDGLSAVPMQELNIADCTLAWSNGAVSDPGWERLLDMPPPATQLSADLYGDVPAPFDIGPYARANAFMAMGAEQTSDVDIIGSPVLRCVVRTSERERPIIARLIDEGRDGTVVRVTTGALALGPGGETEVEIPFQACGWRLRAGHRLTLVLYASGLPAFWNPPANTETHVRDIRLSVPMLPATPRDEATFAEPVVAEAGATEKLKWIDRKSEAIAWPAREHVAVREATTAAHHIPAIGTDYFITSRFEVTNDWAAKSYRIALERPGFSVRIDTRLELSSTPQIYEIRWMITARDGETIVHMVNDSITIARAVS